MFLTGAQILTALAARLKLADSSALSAYWVELATGFHTAAYNEIVSALEQRGFKLDQIVQWDRGAEFERSIAVYLTLLDGGALENYDTTALKAMDRRRELCTVQVTVNSATVRNTDTPGTVTTGAMDSGSDLFGGLDSDDSRVGQPIQW